MKKVTFAAGAAVGYVLGTRAGRDKYEQIVDSARTLHQKPAVQQAESKIKDLVGQGSSAVSTKLGVSGDHGDSTQASFDSEPTSTTGSTEAKTDAASTNAPVTGTTR
jgi:hypothetical protein